MINDIVVENVLVRLRMLQPNNTLIVLKKRYLINQTHPKPIKNYLTKLFFSMNINFEIYLRKTIQLTGLDSQQYRYVETE